MPHAYRNDEQRRLTYQTFQNMKNRCYRTSHATYESYGARGVRVYFGWMGRGGFREFVADVGLRPGRGYQLDRKDSSKGYEPGNVEWRLQYENVSRPGFARSCCTKSVEAVGPDGVKRKIPLYQWAEVLGISYRSLCRRMQRAGSDVSRAFTKGRVR